MRRELWSAVQSALPYQYGFSETVRQTNATKTVSTRLSRSKETELTEGYNSDGLEEASIDRQQLKAELSPGLRRHPETLGYNGEYDDEHAG